MSAAAPSSVGCHLQTRAYRPDLLRPAGSEAPPADKAPEEADGAPAASLDAHGRKGLSLDLYG